jgi:hypothetical protein
MLEPDVTMETADEDVKAVMRRAEQAHPEFNAGVSARVTTVKKRFLGEGIDMIFAVMQVAVFFVLALACINVGNLLLARGNERGRETAIRIALGAPKARLIMQMMWESVIVSFLGGAIAVLLAAWGLEITFGILSTLIDIEPPFWWRATMDAPVVGIALVVTLATAFVTGIVPAWKMSSGDFNAVLRDGTRGAQGKRAGHVGRILVVSEVGLSTALLILSGVLSVVLAQAMRADYGARIDGVLTAQVALPEGSYPDEGKRLRYYEQLSSELSRIPGVDAAGVSLSLPGGGGRRLRDHRPQVPPRRFFFRGSRLLQGIRYSSSRRPRIRCSGHRRWDEYGCDLRLAGRALLAGWQCNWRAPALVR